MWCCVECWWRWNSFSLFFCAASGDDSRCTCLFLDFCVMSVIYFVCGEWKRINMLLWLMIWVNLGWCLSVMMMVIWSCKLSTRWSRSLRARRFWLGWFLGVFWFFIVWLICKSWCVCVWVKFWVRRVRCWRLRNWKLCRGRWSYDCNLLRTRRWIKKWICWWKRWGRLCWRRWLMRRMLKCWW